MALSIAIPPASLSISPSGRDVLLANTGGLYIIDLDSPYDEPTFLKNTGGSQKYNYTEQSCRDEIVDVQWSPHAQHSEWAICATNQTCHLWDLRAQKRIAALKHHMRSITDICWGLSPELLATSSISSYIYLHDLRIPKSVVCSFSDFTAGATSVKWNRVDEDLIASASGSNIRVWDRRMARKWIWSKEGNEGRVWGIDWDRRSRNKICSSGLDGNVNFHDMVSETDTKTISLEYPIWRARHTPFGYGVLIMPQRECNDVFLYTTERIGNGDKIQPSECISTFSGHTDVVKEFVWRPLDMGEEWQLITLSKDNHIKIWPKLKSETLNKVSAEKSDLAKFRKSRLGAPYKTFRTDSSANKKQNNLHAFTKSQLAPTFMTKSYRQKTAKRTKDPTPMSWMKRLRYDKPQVDETSLSAKSNNIEALTGLSVMFRKDKEAKDSKELLNEEFVAVYTHYSNRVNFENASNSDRKCTVTVHGPWGEADSTIFLRIHFQFPNGYPVQSIPTFTLEKTSLLSETNWNIMNKEMSLILSDHLLEGSPSLETCIRYLLGEYDRSLANAEISEDLGQSSDDDLIFDLNVDDGNNKYTPKPNIWPPRRAGGIFCGEYLVCFFNPKSEHASDHARNQSQHENIIKKYDKLMSPTLKPADVRSPKPDSAKRAKASMNTYNDDSDDMSSSDSDIAFLKSTYPYKLDRNLQSVFQKRKSSTSKTKKLQSARKEKCKCFVSIRTDQSYFPAIEVLAKEYVVIGDKAEICRKNAAICEKQGLSVMADAWKVAESIVQIDNHLQVYHVSQSFDTGIKEESHLINRQIGWGDHPLGSELIQELFDFFEFKRDLQMLAMLSLVFAEKGPSIEQRAKQSETSLSVSSPIRTEPPFSPFIGSANGFPSSLGSHSNPLSREQSLPSTPMPIDFFSYSPEKSESRYFAPSNGYSAALNTPRLNTPTNGLTRHVSAYMPNAYSEKNTITIQMAEFEEFEPRYINYVNQRENQVFEYRRIYGDYLLRWGLLSQRSEVLKYNGDYESKVFGVSSASDKKLNEVTSLVISPRCDSCYDQKEEECEECEREPFPICFICHLRVRGMWSGCLICEHGGHAKCLANWVLEEMECPFGCGCQCYNPYSM